MKRTITLLIVITIMTCMLTGCTYSSNTVLNDNTSIVLENARFKTIDEYDYLVYSVDTKIVYYMFSSREAIGTVGYGYSYFAPYIGKNGRFCRYINDEIVEIVVDENN